MALQKKPEKKVSSRAGASTLGVFFVSLIEKLDMSRILDVWM